MLSVLLPVHNNSINEKTKQLFKVNFSIDHFETQSFTLPSIPQCKVNMSKERIAAALRYILHTALVML